MANTLAALLRNNHPCLVQNFLAHTKNLMFKPQGTRFLYSQTTLGLDSYVQQKNRTKNQLANVVLTFREKMKECTSEDSKNMVFTEDLKNMLHLAENDDDINLAVKMLKKFNKQNKQLRFGNYIFGPVIMRMFYLLNKHEEAYECFKSPELNGLFDQLITYQILLDLLYENQQYNKILEAFNIIKERQIEGIKYAKNVVVLAFAACYKLNTKESLDFALNVWSELQNIGHYPMRRATTFCAALALNQGKPEVTLEILTSARNINYTTIRNLRVAAQVDLGRLDDAILVLKSILKEDKPNDGPVQTFNKDIINKVKAAVEKRDSADMKLEFNRIEKCFQEQGQICESSLDEQLCQEIATPPMIGKKSDDSFRRQPRFSRYQRDGGSDQMRSKQSNYEVGLQRPGLADLQ